MRKCCAGVLWIIGMVASGLTADRAAEKSLTVIERGPHHKLSERMVPHRLPDGRVVEQKSQQMELQTGLHYREGDSWLETRELIEAHPDGAVAHFGPHKAAFAANLNTRGAVQLVDADGKRFTSHILGLAFTDSASGRSELIARVKNSIGQILPPNQIVYADAFVEVKASVRYTYRRNGMEQDIIIQEALPVSPADFGMNPATTRLEVFTEFVEAPSAVVKTEMLREEADPVRRQDMVLPDFVDQHLNFGAMAMGPGKAVDFQGVVEGDLPVGKTMVAVEGRTILVEAVEFSTVQRALEKLPVRPDGQKKEARNGATAPAPTRQAAGRAFPAAPRLRAAADQKPMRQTAQLNLKPGFLIDYDLTLATGPTNFTFESGVTYKILGPVDLYGITTIMGGTVLKYARASSNAYVALNGSVVCETTPYRPAVFTAFNDSSVGFSVASGPLTNYFAATALRASGMVRGELHDLRFNFAHTAIDWNGSTDRFYNLQFMNCSNAIRRVNGGTNQAHNILATNVVNLFVGSNTTFNAQHLTAHGITNLARLSGSSSNLTLTNCVLVTVASLGQGNVTGDYLATNSTPLIPGGTSNLLAALPVFQTRVGGHYYLTNNNLLDKGTTNIQPALRTELARSTTFPPLYFTNAIITNTIFSILAYRDTNAPDLGYHYAPLDYIVSHCVIRSNATLVLTNGVAVGVDYSVPDDSGARWGFVFASGGLISVGSPTAMNALVRAHCAQETSTGFGGQRAMFNDDALDDPTQGDSSARFRFTEFSQMVEDGYMFFGGTYWREMEWTHCDLYYAGMGIGGSSNQVLAFTNNIFERSGAWIAPYGNNARVHVRNNLMRESYLSVSDGTTDWTIQDNLFDRMIQLDSSGSISNSHNAYYSNTVMSGSVSNLVLTSLTYERGPLGKYYQPANSPLLDAGSRYATNAGLYHFTTTTNQAPETNSIVDIGFHYVAVDGQGRPLDSNTNGLPNYVEDANGNGVLNPGESQFTTVSVFITSPTIYTAPGTVTLTASASAPHSQISSVLYFSGITELGTSTTPPYSVVWSNLPAGTYVVQAFAFADSGAVALSAPVTNHVNNALLVVGSTNLPGSTIPEQTDFDIRNRLRTNGLFAQVLRDSDATVADTVGKKLVVISRSANPANVGYKFTSNAVPLLTWNDDLYDELGFVATSSSFGNINTQVNLRILNISNSMSAGLSGTIAAAGWATNFSWGIPNSNAVKIAGLTFDTNKCGIFGYESDASMPGLEAPARRVAFFLGNTASTNVTASGWSLFNAAVQWATNVNVVPFNAWLAPTNTGLMPGGTNLTLSAKGSDNDSGLRKVNFYRDGVRVGVANTNFGTTNSFIWSNIVGGTYFMQSKSIDNGQLSTTSTQLVNLSFKSNLLFVVTNATLNASESAISNRLSTNGFTVTVKTATAATTADANGKSLVIISSSVRSNDVNSKFTLVSTPVFVMRRELFAFMGMTATNSSGTNFGTTNLVHVAIPTSSVNHLMSAGLTGTNAVVTNATAMNWARVGSNAIVIASLTNDTKKAVIFGYEKGDLMVGLGTNQLAAPGRRVGFMLTTNNATLLNSNGWKLFDAAIRWAIAKPCYESVDVMLVIDNSRSMTNRALPDARAAAIRFASLLNLTADKVGVVYFASNATTAHPLSQSLTSVVASINAIQMSEIGQTRIDKGISNAMVEFASTNHNPLAQRVMIVMSDGRPTTNSQANSYTNTVNEATNARNAGIRMFTVGFSEVDPVLMATIASTPSDFYSGVDSVDLIDLYSAVADSLCKLSGPPSVTITNPASGAVFNYPANVQINAAASDNDGGVTNVSFYAGTSLLGRSLFTPYSIVWTNPAGGTYNLTAVATDNSALSTTSSIVAITVNLAPVVSITSPTNTAVLPLSPTNLTINVTATDDIGVTKVEFFSGTNKIGQDTSSPYSFVWSNVDDGTYALTARATDNYGVSSTSAVVNITVQGAPLVSIIVPTNLQSFVWSPTNISITATARSLAHGISYVQFFESSNSIGVSFVAPYTNNWRPVFGGTNTLRARAVDSTGRAATSGPVTVTINFAPAVALDLPASGTIFTIPFTNIPIRAIASDSDGNVTNVAFFSGTNSLGNDTTVTYSNYWQNVPPGTHHLWARATDNQGVQTDSKGITVTVRPTNSPPFVFAGSNQTIRLGTNGQVQTQLNGIATDDGLPSGILTSLWQWVSGPTNLSFSPATNPVALATFTTNGTYKIRLMVSDGQFSLASTTTVTVLPQNIAPSVYAGANQLVVLPGPDRYATNTFVEFTSTVYTAASRIMIGVDYFAPSDSIVAAVNYGSGEPFNFALISTNGIASQHSAAHGIAPDATEIMLATARKTTAGWDVGDTFSGSQIDRAIMRISSDGTITDPWVTLAASNGESGKFRGALNIDQTGVFNGDMIAVSQNGNFWRISTNKEVSWLAKVTSTPNQGNPAYLHSVVTVPNDMQRYGPLAGKAIAMTLHGNQTFSLNGDPNLFVVDPSGAWFRTNVEEYSVSKLDIVPAFENCFGTEGLDLKFADFRGFLAYVGDVVLFGEGGETVCLQWTGSNFFRKVVTAPINFEGNAFAPIDRGGVVLPRLKLNGAVADDGLPGGVIHVLWTQASGPSAKFTDNFDKTNTTVRLIEPGEYVFRLTGDDGELTNSAQMSVTVVQNEAPLAFAGFNQTNTINQFNLAGSVTDDGYPSNFLRSAWSVIDAPAGGQVAFFNSNAPQTEATFTKAGTYHLRLTGYDGQAAAEADAFVTILPPAVLTLNPSNSVQFFRRTVQTVQASLLTTNGSAIVGSNVTLTVEGPNARQFSTNTDANGRAVLVFEGIDSGIDTVTASSFVNGIWLVSPPTSITWSRYPVIGCGGEASGDLPYGPHTNWYEIDLAGGTAVILNLTWTMGDSGIGLLRHLDRTILPYDFDDGFTVNSNGTYWLEVSASPDSTTHYELTVACTGNGGWEPGTPPYVSISSPTNRKIFEQSPAQFAVQTHVSDPAEVLGVEIYTNGFIAASVVTDDPNPSLYLQNLSVGTYALRAVAYTAANTLTSAVVIVTVANRPDFHLYAGVAELSNHSTLDYGITTVLTSVVQTLTISNLGSAPLHVLQISNNGDFTVTQSPVSPIPVGASASMEVQFNASAYGRGIGSLAVFSDDGDFGNGIQNPFVLNLTAIANATGTPPTISLSAPTNGLVATAPAAIPIAATASSASPLAKVEFFSAGTVVARIGRVEGNGGSYAMTWNNVAPGSYSITAVATDVYGRTTRSAPVSVTVISNNSPQAVSDSYVVLLNSSQNLFNVLANDTDLDGDSLKIVSIAVTNGGTPVIVNDGKAIQYIPPPNTYGSDGFRYVVSDGRGKTASAWVYLNIVLPLPQDVTLAVSPTPGPYAGGTMLTLTATPSSPALVTRMDFFANGRLIGSGTTSPFTVAWDAIVDTTNLTAVSYDTLGQSGEGSVGIHVDALSPDGDPRAAFSNLTNQVTTVGSIAVTNQIAVVRDGLFVVRGSAFDLSGYAPKYKLRLYRADGSLLRDLTPDWIAQSVNNGPLFTNDFTMLRNDIYQMELLVSAGGREASTNVTFALDSELKVGQFSFSQQDMVIPVAGLPLSVIRTYSTLNPNSGDFGNSWTYSIHDLEMSINEDRAPTEDVEDDAGEPQIFSLRVGGGRDVTLTLPDGRRTTFAFYLEQGDCNPGDNAPFCFYAKWVAPPDVYYTLTPLGDNKLINLFGNYWWAADSGVNFESFDFPGFLLTARDETQYRLDREDLGEHWYFGGAADGNSVHAYGKGKLTKITQRTGDTISIGSGSITHNNAAGQPTRQVTFQRDISGRIVSIVDPNGTTNVPAVKYEYDFFGNLVRVLKLTDRANATYETNTYVYGNPNFPSYITEIRDARGVTPLRTLYDNDGRMVGTVDAFGFTNRVVHGISQSLTNNSEIIWDRSGHATTHYFDSRGNVTLTIDALGKATSRAYDGTNNITSMTDALSNTTFYAYDTAGNRTRVVDALLRTNYFSYDTSGNLLTQTDPLGNVTSNRYSGAGLLTDSIHLNAQGQVVDQTSYIYSGGQLVETRNLSNQVVSAFGYDSTGNLTNTADANGFNRGFRYDANGNQTNSFYVWAGPGGNVTVSTLTVLDAGGRVTQTIDANGNTNRAFYNAIGKVAYSIDKFGNTNGFQYDARGNLIETKYPDGTVTRTVYDSEARPMLTTDRNGITGTKVTYDDVGRVVTSVRLKNVQVSITSDANNAGQVLSTISAAGTALATNATAYFDNGWVKSRTGPEGKATTYEYWPDGHVKTVTDPFTNTTFYSYDEAGRQQLVRDALTNETQFVYDALGRMVKTIYADTSYSSNAFNPLGQRVGQIDQAGLLTKFDYTLAGQLKAVTKPPVTDPQNAALTVSPKWSYDYDAYGRLAVMTDPKGRTNNLAYDAMGRQLTRRLPMGQTETNLYNALGQLWKKVDLKNQTTEFVYDRFGRVKAKFYFDAGAAYPSNAVCYQYNTLGQLAKIVERSGADASTNACDGYTAMVGFVEGERVTRWAVLVRVDGRCGGPLLALGLLVLAWVRTPEEVKRRLADFYLRGGWRLANLSEPCVRRLRLPSLWWRFVTLLVLVALVGTDPQFSKMFEARAQCVFPANVSTETTRITEFGYDFDGRLAQVNAPEGVINYGYDLATGRHTSTCTTNSETAYGYDELGRLKTVTALKRNGVTLSTPEVTTYTYTKVGSRETVTLPNSVVSTWRYDNLNRLTNLTHKIGTTNLASYTYQLHPTGRRTNAIEVLKQEDGSYLTNTLGWQYDGMYRLTNEVSASSLTAGTFSTLYQYDEVGNRLKKIRQATSTDTIDYSYNSNDQLLQEISTLNGTINYAYDANGSLTGKTNGSGTITYDYNLLNKMRAVTVGGTTTSFLYNDSGIRVRSTTGGSATHFLIDANNHTGYAQVLEEMTTPGASPTRSYVLGDDVLSQCGTTTNAPSYLLYDGHGSTRQLANSAAAVTSRYNYDAYGVTLGSSSTTPETSLLYCGEQLDSTLGMYNLRARFYDAGNGRFNQRDAFEGINSDPESLHKYAYANLDPVNMVDPSGYMTLLEQGLALSMVLVGSLLAFTMLTPVMQRSDLNIQIYEIGRQMSAAAGEFTDGFGQAGSEAFAAAASAAGLLVARISDVLKAVRQAIDEALKLARQTLKELIKIPKYLIVRSFGQTIFNFDSAALAARPDWFLLTYNGPNSPITTQNRAYVRSTWGYLRASAPLGYQLDEFPYATTFEGGSFGPALGRMVPPGENAFQGGTLGAFYRWGKLRGAPGRFLVVPVPI